MSDSAVSKFPGMKNGKVNGAKPYRAHSARTARFVAALRATSHALKSRPKNGETISVQTKVNYHAPNEATLTVRVRID